MSKHGIVVVACMCSASGTARARATSKWAVAARRRAEAETWPAARDSVTEIGKCSRRHTTEQSKQTKPEINSTSLLV